MKLASLASVVSCALSFLAGLAYAGGFARAPARLFAPTSSTSSCDGAVNRRVEARDLTLPDGRVARVVMVDESVDE